MRSLVAFSCLLALTAAKPGVQAPISYTSHVAVPAGYSYSTYIGGSPVAYSVVAAPLAQSRGAHIVAAGPIAAVEKSQYHAQDELGQASYGHSEALQAHNAVQDAAGNKVGSYSYIAPDGQIISTNYIADGLGYRVASNALSVAPNVVPVAPSETPEVIAARAAHLKAHEIVKSRSRRSIAIATPTTYSVTYSAPVVHPTVIPLAYSAPATVVAGHPTSYLV